jgi:formamidopyrimidine-DNA glycosylase
MPELPEVETVKNALAGFAINLEIQEIVINQHCLRNSVSSICRKHFLNLKF